MVCDLLAIFTNQVSRPLMTSIIKITGSLEKFESRATDGKSIRALHSQCSWMFSIVSESLIGFFVLLWDPWAGHSIKCYKGSIYITLQPFAMATHSSALVWKVPWTEEPGRLQSMGSLSRTWLSDFTFTFYCHALEKEMAPHSSILAPGMGEPGRLPSMGSHRVGHKVT